VIVFGPSCKLLDQHQKQLELNSKGIHQADIARILKISEPTILRDLYYLKQDAKQTIQNYIDDRLPYEYRKCLEGLDAILRMAWSISSQQNIDSREKVQALSLAKECYSQKLDLLTNAEVIHHSIKFIES
jgi:DNA-binding Lrp family transcriptional regulator